MLIVIDPGAAGWQEELARLKALVTGPHAVILTKKDIAGRGSGGQDRWSRFWSRS